MIVITRYSEETFLRELEYLNDRSSDRRCLFIRFSLLPERASDWFSRLNIALEDIADGHIGQVYVCEDGDVLAIMPHLTDKHMKKFMAQYPESFEDSDFQRLCSLHQIRQDRVFLKSVCERKLDILREKNLRQEKEKDAGKDNETIEKILKNIDISGIAQRRAARDAVDILVIEDDPLSRMMMKNVLMEDFTVHLASDAQTALEGYASLAPDVVFLDIGLPDISGHMVLESIMRIDPGASIIMFSGRKDQDNILKALNAGAMGFVAKPFTRGKLYQYIDQSPEVQEKKSRKNRNQSRVV